MIILRDFRDLIEQSLGTKNIFGYRSKAANQLYLLYCLSGKIYFTDKLHRFTKWFWFLLNLTGLCFAYAIGLSYFVFDTSQDIVMRLTILYALGTSTNIVVLFPMISYRHRVGIESMIRVLDDYLSSPSCRSSPKYRDRINAATILIYNGCVTVAMNAIYSVVPYLDAMIFYNERKVRNPMYYTLPLPNLHRIGNKSLFSASAVLISSFYSVFAFEWIAMINFILFWGVTCHNELMHVIDRLAYDMDTWQMRLKPDTSQVKLDKEFDQILKRLMEDVSKITRAIEHYRGFVELFCSLAIPVIFLIQVVQLYFVISLDMPFSIRLKGISFFVTAGWPMFLMYWTGQILENAVSAVSLSVYTTPWYRVLKVRKDVHIFLCQTQRAKNLYMFKVFPLILRNYSRLSNGILSSVNILRRLTFETN